MGLAVRISPRELVPVRKQNDGRFNIRRRFTWKDFNTAATTANNDTLILPGGVAINRIVMSLITAFSGGSVSAATLSAGTTGSAVAYLGATNVFTGATAGGACTTGAGASLNAFAGGNATPNALGTVRLQLLTTTDNASSLTAGVVDVFLEISTFDTRTS